LRRPRTNSITFAPSSGGFFTNCSCTASWVASTRETPSGRAAIDQELGPIVQGPRGIRSGIVSRRFLADPDLADLAASAAPMHVIGDNTRAVCGMRVQPPPRLAIGFEPKLLDQVRVADDAVGLGFGRPRKATLMHR